jgi:hypothetical protein
MRPARTPPLRRPRPSVPASQRTERAAPSADLITALLPVAEAVEEPAEDAAFAGKGGARWGCDGALAGNGLIVVGAGNGVDNLGLVKGLRAFDLRHVADEHAVAHDLGFEAGRAVGVPLGLATARQRYADAELTDTAAEQVSVDATVTKGIDHPTGPEFVHARKIAPVPERCLNVRADIAGRRLTGARPSSDQAIIRYCPRRGPHGNLFRQSDQDDIGERGL